MAASCIVGSCHSHTGPLAPLFVNCQDEGLNAMYDGLKDLNPMRRRAELARAWPWQVEDIP